MLYRVARKSADLLRMALVTTVAMLAISALALVETTNTAEATSLPDNGKIAFISDRDGEYHIYTADPDGSNLRQLTHGTDYGSRPMWSPDGTKMTSAAHGGNAGVMVMNADGSNRKFIPTDLDVTGSLSYFPAWSADGTKLTFSSGDPSNPIPPSVSLPSVILDIYEMNLDGSNPINLTRTPKYDERFADFSPDGSQMCFTFDDQVGEAATGIYLASAGGSHPTLLLKGYGQCDWSPDGTKIAVGIVGGETSDQANLDSEVIVMNADGSGLANLTSNSAYDETPRWSPDGTKITFMSDRDGDRDIYIMDADGSDVAPVTTDSGSQVSDDLEPDWQPLPKPTPPKVHPPDTGGPSLLLVASALLFSGGVLLYAMVRPRM